MDEVSTIDGSLPVNVGSVIIGIVDDRVSVDGAVIVHRGVEEEVILSVDEIGVKVAKDAVVDEDAAMDTLKVLQYISSSLLSPLLSTRLSMTISSSTAELLTSYPSAVPKKAF
ncbi:hypothetical protein NDU88_003772 [Pleurodeles waltl]|uniref:Uncharacterized protein n=1 Tax=Pleurodeles waltl TaxID=8319 RepID=A0AAV7L6T4_PLEWA|nr:hypothetical protein NDU88_003772 [Pleurodeles waltl]